MTQTNIVLNERTNEIHQILDESEDFDVSKVNKATKGFWDSLLNRSVSKAITGLVTAGALSFIPVVGIILAFITIGVTLVEIFRDITTDGNNTVESPKAHSHVEEEKASQKFVMKIEKPIPMENSSNSNIVKHNAYITLNNEIAKEYNEGLIKEEKAKLRLTEGFQRIFKKTTY